MKARQAILACIDLAKGLKRRRFFIACNLASGHLVARAAEETVMKGERALQKNEKGLKCVPAIALATGSGLSHDHQAPVHEEVGVSPFGLYAVGQ